MSHRGVKTCALLLPIFIVVTVTLTVSQGRSIQQRTGGAMAVELQRDLGRIESFRGSRNLDELVKVADEVESRWSNRRASDYAELMLRVSDTLSSVDFDNEEQYVLAQKYAKAALQKAAEMPVDLQLHLILHLRADIEYERGGVRGEEWVKVRNAKTKMWLQGWQQLRLQMNRSFDFNDVPSINVSLPAGAIGVAGMSPAQIKDPKVRAEYEDAIAANARKAEEYRRQYKLRQLDQLFSPKAEEYVVRAYSREPANLSELKQLLETYIDDYALREKILNEVTKPSSQ